MTQFHDHIRSKQQRSAEGREVLEQVQKSKVRLHPQPAGQHGRGTGDGESLPGARRTAGRRPVSTPTEQQVIMLAVSRLQRVRPIASAHIRRSPAHAEGPGRRRSSRFAATSRLPMRNSRRYAALRRSMVDQQGWLSDEDTRRLSSRPATTSQQVLEVVLGVAMKTISNYTNHIAGSVLDDAFADFAWQAPRGAVA